jgi:hypothetical protein
VKETLDFIVIGAQKAGTTSLFEYLRRHPQIALPANKEAPYFSHDGLFETRWDAYLRKMALGDPEQQWGTVTPHYMIGGVHKRTRASADARERYDERTVPLRIHERLPDVRLVAILRDPVTRARSHYQMMVLKGSERRPFDEAIADLLDPQALERARRRPVEDTGYVTWGEYARILGAYFEVFAREQILVLFTDELERSPEQLLVRVHEFLGVSTDFVPDNLGVRYRVGATERRLPWPNPNSAVSPGRVKRRLRRSATAQAGWRRLPKAPRTQIKRGVDELVYRVDLWNRRSRPSIEQPTSETEDRLREHFAQEGGELTAQLGVSPPWLAARASARHS